VKRGLELGRMSSDSVRAGEFVGGETKGLRWRVLVQTSLWAIAPLRWERGDLHFDGDRFVFEITCGDGGESFLVGLAGNWSACSRVMQILRAMFSVPRPC